jgi:hypothetical protein
LLEKKSIDGLSQGRIETDGSGLALTLECKYTTFPAVPYQTGKVGGKNNQKRSLPAAGQPIERQQLLWIYASSFLPLLQPE